MNILRQELRSQLKTALIWTVVMVTLAALFLSIYPGMAKDAADYKKLLEAYPASVRAMLSINLDTITSVLGFYSMIFSFITLCGAIEAMILGMSVLSKESRERTADFLLVKPVSRAAIVSAKLLASFLTIVAVDAVFLAAVILLASAVATSGFSMKIFFLINLTLFFVQLIFLTVGMAVSVFFRKIRSVLPMSLGIVLAFYMIGALLTVGGDEKTTRFLSPFRYFDVTYIIQHASYEIPYAMAGAVIAAAAVAVTYVVYIKKDIHAVS